ncbi:unnamed protein product, partial [Discosporangium mesarthrocarpum]
MRKGKWTNEEEAFTARIIHHFNCGVLQLPEGTTLRAYLAEKLECDPMRITKKFTGSNCLGKRVYHSCERTPATFEEIKVANAELAVLEARFHSQLERNKERKAGLMNMEHRERERNEKSLGDGRVAGEGTGGVSSDSGGGESSHASMDGSSGGCDIGGTSSGSRSDSSRSNGGSKRSRDKTSSHPMPRKHRLQMPSGGGSSRRDRDNRRLSLLTSASRQCHPRPGSTLGGVSEGGGGGGDGGG